MRGRLPAKTLVRRAEGCGKRFISANGRVELRCLFSHQMVDGRLTLIDFAVSGTDDSARPDMGPMH